MELENSSMRLILASASPRRADLLRAAGFEFETSAANVDECVRANEPPAEYVQRLASEKSAAVQAAMPSTTLNTPDSPVPVAQAFPPPPGFGEARPSADRGGGPASDIIILGADTTVVVAGLILGKPQDDEASAAMLRQLSGRRHEVLTGISLRAGNLELRRVEITGVYFAELSEDDVAWYVQSGEGRDKAGAYAIQGLASRFIPRIEGSYANVVGLPVAVVVELIRALTAAPPLNHNR
jgi:septum formation protein